MPLASITIGSGDGASSNGGRTSGERVPYGAAVGEAQLEYLHLSRPDSNLEHLGRRPKFRHAHKIARLEGLLSDARGAKDGREV